MFLLVSGHRVGHLAAPPRSHLIGDHPSGLTKEQRTETMNPSPKSATATKFHISFSPFFLARITYRHVRCPFVQKEKIKKVSPFEKWNLPSAIARNWFQLSPLFSQRQLYLWRHLPNTRLMILEGFQSVFGSSICEMSVDSEAQFGQNLSESSSEGCSESQEASFNSASEDF